MAFVVEVVEVVVGRGVDGGECLQGLYVPEFGHYPFPSSERLVRVFRPIVEPLTLKLTILDSDDFHRCII